jgi:hypothetical protein
MNDFDWPEAFRRCYDKAVAKYREGNGDSESYFDAQETAFLASIGCKPQEIYDFAEDWCTSEEPSFATALLITAGRRDYFLVVQHGKPSGRTIRMADLPPGGAEEAGFRWLPRIIAKARAKLRGEMPPELMYGCGGDRPFLRSVNIHPADFLREVWAARDDDSKIIEYVKVHARKPGN